ncbi:MAG: restriction endonuclease, partial [Opitutales bacterium]|nr:restriction endonuclease [Opitutales bacterium]
YGGLSNGGGVTKKSNDEGIDGIINQDKLGLDVIYLQAKRWKGDIGRPEIQNFVGALAGKHATKGIFITTSKFSEKAIEYVKNVSHKIILIDGDMLTKLMIDYDVGVSTYSTIKLKRVDSDYFNADL